MDISIKRRLIETAIASALVLAIGTFGYYYLTDGKNDLFTCFYMTVITITTIGYAEIIEMNNHTSARLFTVFLAFSGIGLITYFVSTVSVVFIEGHLRKSYRKRKMENIINKLEDHYIICGIGRHSLHLLEELAYYRSDNVCIEISNDVIEKVTKTFSDLYYVEGDASQDEILLKAGIEKAKGIFATTSDDNLNLVICLSARRLNPKIKIVSLCVNHRNMGKIKMAGADNVISTNYIGGLRMASEMLRPSITHVLDIMLREKHKNIRIEEIIVSEKESGIKIGELKKSEFKDALIIAVKTNDKFIFKPDDSLQVNKNDELIVLSTPEKDSNIR